MNDVQKHFDEIAGDYDKYKKKNKYYYDNLKKLLRILIPKQKTVLEVGCGTGDLLVHLKPKKGYGVDISSQMIKIAQKKHKKQRDIKFSTKRISQFKELKLDYIFMSDVIEHLEKPSVLFGDINSIMNSDTKFIITMANPIWEPVLMISEKLGLKMPEGKHYRWKYSDISKMLRNEGLKTVNHSYSLLVPVDIPLVTKSANNYLEPLLTRLCFIEYAVIKKR